MPNPHSKIISCHSISNAFFLMFKARKYDIIHFNDATMAALIPAIRLFSRAKISFTVHGLDILYEKFGYQRLIPASLKVNRVFAVSRHARQLCIEKDVPPEIVAVIPNGINLELVQRNTPEEIKAVLDKFGIDPAGRKLLFSVGRLIKRKGFAWFLENVIPLLPPGETIHIIAGRGVELPALKQQAKGADLKGRVFFPGYVTDGRKTACTRPPTCLSCPISLQRTTRKASVLSSWKRASTVCQ